MRVYKIVWQQHSKGSSVRRVRKLGGWKSRGLSSSVKVLSEPEAASGTVTFKSGEIWIKYISHRDYNVLYYTCTYVQTRVFGEGTTHPVAAFTRLYYILHIEFLLGQHCCIIYTRGAHRPTCTWPNDSRWFNPNPITHPLASLSRVWTFHVINLS